MSHDEHDDVRDLFAAYQAGELSDEDRAFVDEHLDGCAECASLLDEVRPEEVPPKARLIDRLKQAIPLPRSNPLLLRGVLAGAATFFLGIVGYVIAEMETPAQESDAVMESMAVVAPVEIGRPPDVHRRQELPTGERDIFFPEARGDHNESAGEDSFKIKGDSTNFLSYIRGESLRPAGVYDTMGMGAGGGGGGRYGGRFGGRENLVRNGGPSVAIPFKPVEAVRAFQEKDAKPEEPALVARGGGSVKAKPQEEAPRMSRKIIRSGEMEFEIDSFDGAVGTLTKIAIEEQGFIATINSEKLQNGKVRGTVVVRVPPERLDTLLLKLRALGELKSQRIGSEDVTKHYLDLESRLRAARTMEERLLTIIKEGKGAIKDLLAAEKELGEWRTRIETMVGEINYYNNLIAHSTLTITLYEKEIRAPFGLVETEKVEMGLEVEEVEKAYTAALAAVAEAKGRVQRSELKQLGQGQFNAIVAFEAAPAQAGMLRDRFKQLGVLARLDINRSQEAQGGSGKPQDAKVLQNDTQFLVSIYNLVNVSPRETVVLNLACTDTEKAYKSVLDRVEKAAGRILSSNLSREKADLSTGRLQFQVRSADADALLQDIRTAGEVLKLDVTETQDVANSTRTKRGFQVNFFGLGTVQARETSTVVLAAKDVAEAYRQLLAAAKGVDARILTASLSESDRKTMTANLSIEFRREHEATIADAVAKAGDVYTRSATRATEGDSVTDSKLQIHFRFFNAAGIPARETVKLSIEVGDVEAVSKALESEYKGRVLDAKHTRDAGGRRESTLTIDLPLKEAAGAVERVKSLGSVLEHVSSRNAAVPDNDLALAHLELKLSNEVLVGHDSGPLANIRRGLAISLQAGSWALMLIMVGVCFVCPLLLALWGGLKLKRRLGAKPAAAAPAA